MAVNFATGPQVYSLQVKCTNVQIATLTTNTKFHALVG